MNLTEPSPDSIGEPDAGTWLPHRVSGLDVLLVLVSSGRAMLLGAVACGVIGVLIALLLPNVYTGRTVILTPVAPISISGLLSGGAGQLSQLSAASQFGLTDPNDQWVAILSGDTIAARIVRRFQLQKVYDKRTMTGTIAAFKDHCEISSGHDGTITIQVDDDDPRRAAAIANAMVEELRVLSRELDASAANQRRLFYTKEVEKAKQSLAQAEDALQRTQQQTGVLDLDKQATAIVTSMATLRGQIAAQEIMIAGLRTTATAANPDLIRAQQQLAAMRSQLARSVRQEPGGNGDPFIATAKLPAAGLEYLRKLRDVEFYGQILEAMSMQYEAAQADSGSGGAAVPVVDPAVPPDEKSGPHRLLMVLLFAALGAAGAGTWKVGRELWARLQLDPLHGPAIVAFSTELRMTWTARTWRRLRRRGFPLKRQI
jgi:tyrosine-protein kinase Etk/Wzc